MIVLLATVGIMERIPPLRRALENRPIMLMEKGQLLQSVIEKNLVESDDLDKVAHDYGMPDHKAFDAMILEGDGSITGVLKSEFRPQARGVEASAPGI